MAAKYYAVKKGKVPGIYKTWEECEKQIKHFSGAVYKSFICLEDAEEFLKDEKPIEYCEYVAYVDGSYNAKTQEYSFGAILIHNNTMLRFNKKFGPDEYSKSRNVAGELKGAAFIINYAYKNGIKEIVIYHDYTGIKEFYVGNWTAKEVLSQKYQSFAFQMKDKIKVHFVKVKSHSNDLYNDIVDSLAK